MGAGVAVALLVTAGVARAGTAVAAGDPPFSFGGVEDKTLMPGGERARLKPETGDGQPDGTYVYVISKKPLTDAGWSGGGLPAGLTVTLPESCAPKPGITGVYLCDALYNPGPEVKAATTAVNGVTAYYGLVYVPRGASISAGIKEAQTAGSKAIGPRRAHATVTAKTKAHVAQNTIALTTPNVPAGGVVSHTVKLHAVDTGRLGLFPSPAPGFRQWDDGELKVVLDGVDDGGAPGARCAHTRGEFGAVLCDIEQPGDYTITYRLKAEAAAPAWGLRYRAIYYVYTSPPGDPEKSVDFAVDSSTPVIERFRFMGRSTEEWLWDFQTRVGSAEPDVAVDGMSITVDWNQYSAMTRLGALTVQSTGPGMVARDKSGVLWFYGTSGTGRAFKDRVRVGSGWNTYDTLVGVSDVTGDKKADLLARDAAGGLWLYAGTGVDTRPFATKVQVGRGWGVYDQLVGGVDLTADGKADLVARDKTGRLFLYEGTGVA
ncbi:FG-GAP repeat domain-containing protein, partial [Streptomyces sp. NPDC056773]|uniref:FG-GAP repeat domain-containing protein n=1 Tax=Streptomyces sp. NPDC056773 TaxID=3345941 RepID=UPI0036AD42C8